MVVVLLMPHISGMAYILGGCFTDLRNSHNTHTRQWSLCVCFFVRGTTWLARGKRRKWWWTRPTQKLLIRSHSHGPSVLMHACKLDQALLLCVSQCLFWKVSLRFPLLWKHFQLAKTSPTNFSIIQGYIADLPSQTELQLFFMAKSWLEISWFLKKTQIWSLDVHFPSVFTWWKGSKLKVNIDWKPSHTKNQNRA